MRGPAARVLQYTTRNHHHLGYSIEEGRGPHTDAVTPIIGGIQRVGRRLLSERHAAYLRINCGRSGTPFLLFSCEPDQKRSIGHVPYPCDHCVGGCQYSFAPAPYLPPSAPRGGAEGGWGEGEGAKRAPQHRQRYCVPLASLIKHPDCSSGTYRTRATIA
jgi:hypothetical protein